MLAADCGKSHGHPMITGMRIDFTGFVVSFHDYILHRHGFICSFQWLSALAGVSVTAFRNNRLHAGT